MIREAPLTAVRELLTDEMILQACRACGHRFRERLYGPVVTVLHFAAQALQPEHSFAATWEQLWTPGAARGVSESPVPFDPSALTHARKRLPAAVMRRLADQACAAASGLCKRRWRGLRLLALDATTVSMSRDPALFTHFGTHRARTTTVRYPLGTWSCLVSLEDALILGYRFGPFDPGEVNTTLPLLAHLQPGDLLLADRHYAGSPFLARLQATGADFLMRKNARLIVGRLPVLRRLGTDDFITEIPMSKPAHHKDPTLPAAVRVRLFRATWQSPAGERITEWFVTSLHDAARFRKRTLAKLYHRRWRVETSYHELKCTLHADVLRSKTVANVYKEIAAHVLAYQLIRRLIVAAGRRYHKEVTQISFLHAARWVVHFSHCMAASPTRMLPDMYHALLAAIATCDVDVRPGRIEPRALTREWKHYPHLRTSRTQWRKQRLRNAG
jgi:hypothetical protein